MNGQRGQAIVGVLVIMTLVFLLTGAVAVGTSTLLTRLRGPATTVDADLAVRSAAAGAAGVALGFPGCGFGTPPRQSQGTVRLPASGDIRPTQVQVSCAMVDHALNQVSRVDIGSGVCTTTDISGQLSGKTEWWILFAARFPRGGLAYVASATDSCATTIRTEPADRVCPAQVFQPAAGTSVVIALALHCSTQTITKPALFVFNAQAGFPVYLVPHDTVTTGSTSTNSFYLAAAGTGLPHPDVEQVLLFQPASSSSVPHPSPELRFEGVQS